MNVMTSNPFLQWYAAGYHELVPVVPPDAPLSDGSYIAKNKAAGKAPGIRYGSGLWGGLKGWQEVVATPDNLASWGAMGASTGLRRGAAFMLDIDAMDPAVSEEIEAIAVEMFGPAPCRVGREPKRGLLYRADGFIPACKLIFDGPNGPNQVEIPNQAVVQGVHPGTRKPYSWPRPPVPFDQLASVTPAALNAFFERLRPMLPNSRRESSAGAVDRDSIDQEKLKGPRELTQAIMRALPNTAALFPSYDDMVKVGEALHAASRDFPDTGVELWHDWCSRWEGNDYDYEQTEARWKTFDHKHAVGFDWLRRKADAAGVLIDGAPPSAVLHLDVLPDAPEATRLFEAAERTQAAADKAEDAKERFKLLEFDEAADNALVDPAPPLIKGLLDQGTMSVLYGDSNVGKTFVAMDMAFHIAAGRSYAGMKTTRGLVVYVASEGGRGAKRRLTALRDKYGNADRPDFLLLPAAVDLRNPEVDLNAFKSVLLGLGRPIALLVIDTLSRAMAGGDENGSVDMGAFVRNVDVLRGATGTHAMIVHHTGKDKAKGARGHTLLRAAIDTEIEVSEGLITVTKQRDLDKSWTSAFRLEVRTVGVDADGDKVTSCTVRLDGATAESKREPTEGEAAVIAVIQMLSETSHKPEDGARTSDIEAYCKDGRLKLTRDALNAHLRSLRTKRLISQPKRGFWLSECVEKASTHSVFGQPVRAESVESVGECVEDVFA